MNKKAILRIFRFNPDIDKEPYYRDYEVPLTEDIQTLLVALFYIQENIDSTLSFRFFCRSAVCGSCAVKVNGISRLACKTPFRDLVKDDKPIIIEPLNNLPVIKDLVVDHEKGFENLKKIQTWLEPKKPVPEKEYLVYPSELKKYQQATNCILCFACYGVCEAVEDRPEYAGPYAFSRAYRYVADSRNDENHKKEIIKHSLEEGFLWSCVQCQKCIYVCPKGVRPAEDIQQLRGISLKYGYEEKAGAKKLQHFIDWIYATGQINRLALPEEVYQTDSKPLIEKFRQRGAEVWEVPKPLPGLLEFRDLILEVINEKGGNISIDFHHVRKIDKKVEEIFKADVCTQIVSKFEEKKENFFERFWKRLGSFFGI